MESPIYTVINKSAASAAQYITREVVVMRVSVGDHPCVQSPAKQNATIKDLCSFC